MQQLSKLNLNEVDRQISDKRAELNTNASLSQSQQLKLSKDLSSLSDNRKTLTTQHSSKISSVTTAVKAVPNLTATPKYMVKGFWHIPDTKSTMYGDQNVVQFKIAYRILSKTGTAEKVEQITFTDPSGNKIVGAFSPWKETLSKVRGKIYNTATGFYQWAPEKISDPNTVNINQVEIPISKGQVVEVRVKSLSEAGFPDSPVESEWSNSILVEFPASLQSLEDISIISQQAFAEEAKISFQEDLNSKGLDLHLGTAFTSRDKYFAHKTDDIASGFFSSDGSIVDLYTKLKTISDSLAAVQTAIASGAGQLKVSIIDPNGNQISVTNGQTVQLFAGYYKDLIKNNSSKSVQYEHGKIISAQYYIQLENTSQTNLELISVLTGGLGETAPVSIPTQVDPYNTSLRYDKVPISIASSTLGNLGSFNQSEGLQSAQVKGQIIYSRANTVGLADRLVAAEPINTNSSTVIEYIPSSNYSYKGAVKNKTTMPYDSGHYVPYNPTLKAITYTVANVPKVLSVSPSVWNGVIDTSNSPIGGGLLTEFCISIDHPDIKAGGKYNKQWPDLYRPIPILASGVSLLLADSISLSNTKQPTLPFSHGAHFEITQNELVNPLGAKYYQQAAYFKPLAISSANGTTVVTSDMREKNYPIKTSFSANDQYLIGKYTCGAYMYIAPASYSAIGATSFSPIAVKATVPYGTTSAIKIPLIFQYRCSDYLKYIGGFRADATGGLQNVKYAKKLGFDIGLKNDMFSFDVEISAQYEKETAVLTPFTVTQSSVVVNNALTA